jgi:hypothetical protein
MKRSIETLPGKFGGGGFLRSHPANEQRIINIEVLSTSFDSNMAGICFSYLLLVTPASAFIVVRHVMARRKFIRFIFLARL